MGERTSHVVGYRLVEFELHPTQPVCDVHVVNALHEDGPGVGVVVGDAGGFGVRLFVEWLGGGAVDEGTEYLHAFYALPCWRRHGDGSEEALTTDVGRGLGSCENARCKFNRNQP
jgi:GNAT superfamily N-acetyltransferase